MSKTQGRHLIAGILIAVALVGAGGAVRAQPKLRVLGLAISAALNAPIEKQRFGVFRM